MANSTLKYWNSLYPQFIGSATILNNGVTPNSFTIGITNNNPPGSDSTVGQIIIDETTPIYLWFIVDNKQDTSTDHNRDWALTTQSQLYDDAVKINFIGPDGKDHSTDWEMIPHQPTGTPLYSSMAGWKLVPKANKSSILNPGKTLRIIISGIVTDLPNGDSIAYLDTYYPTEDKPDSRSVLQICYLHKTPDIIRGDRVGIGINKPQVTLDVNGGIRAKGGPPGGNGKNNTGFFFNGPGDNDSGMSSTQNSQVEFYVNSREAIRIIDNIGTKVGIAQQDPKATLHIAQQYGDNEIALLLDGKNVIEFGGGITPKGGDAGKIGYKTWTDGLDIVGAAEEGNNRKITLHVQGNGGLTILGNTTIQGKSEFQGNSEIQGELALHDSGGHGVIYFDPDKAGNKQFIIRTGTEQGYNNILSLGPNFFNLTGKPAIKYQTFKNVSNHTNTPTGIPSADYIAIIAGWESKDYDLNENNKHNWAIRMIDEDGEWKIYINNPHNHKDWGSWTVDVIAFHRNFSR